MFVSSQPGSMYFLSAVPGTASYYFTQPVSSFTAYSAEELSVLFRQLDEAAGRGLYAAGYLTYEAGYLLEPSLQRLAPADGKPIAHFAFYKERTAFTYKPHPASIAMAEPSLAIGRDAYQHKIDRIKEHIANGDTYQLNLTTQLSWPHAAPAEDLLHHILAVQPVEFGALLPLGDIQILSASPELFFRRKDRHIVTRPMKGTAPRGRTRIEDQQQAAWLANDEKNRAENLMIVDLLRNDLGRICTTGSVRVESLFEVERYSTLHQMTSTISGDLKADTTWGEVFRALFPSGSIVGAPKIKSMELIHGLEDQPRGVYTGCIGFITPEREAVFSVAIRTIELREQEARMGIGSGITWDSDPVGEYEECLLKANFLRQDSAPFHLIETMLWDGRQIVLLDEHIRRLADSAGYFAFTCDTGIIRDALLKEAGAQSSPQRIRLLLAEDGTFKLQSTPLVPDDRPLRVLVSTHPTRSHDRFLFHKTTRRRLYDEELARAQQLGYGEALFLNERGEITEGAISNFFVEREGKLYTPPLSAGLLPGILRTDLSPEERTFTPADLKQSDRLYLGNSVRGLRPIAELDFSAVQPLSSVSPRQTPA